jgi:hypothetical protein
MQDTELIARIGELVDEEHRLERELAGQETADPDVQQRVADLEVALDQCWDLLRQRRARRSAGIDPDDASVRDAGTVEGYRQ